MTKEDARDIFLDLQDELATDITVQLGRFDPTGALVVAQTANEQSDDVMLNFKASSNQVKLDKVLNELRDGLGRFLSTHDQYSGEVSLVIRLRNEER